MLCINTPNMSSEDRKKAYLGCSRVVVKKIQELIDSWATATIFLPGIDASDTSKASLDRIEEIRTAFLAQLTELRILIEE